jgi:hypothetical protein
MAVTGVFTADFSNFDKAVQQSEANLGKLDTAGGKVSRSLALMTAEQEKLLTSIGAAGGRMEEMGEKTGAAAEQVNAMTVGSQALAGILGTAGAGIPGFIKNLDALAQASGKTAAALGTFATASLIEKAWKVGWAIGEWADEWLHLSDAIAGASEQLLKAESAAAKQDTINAAIRQGGTDVRTYADAVKYLSELHQVNTDKAINWRGVLSDAHREVRNLTAAQIESITIAQESGATVEQITHKYGVSALALQLLADKQDAASAAAKAHTAELKEQERAAAALDKQYEKLMSDTKNANQLAIMNADAAALETERNNAKAVSIKGITDVLGAMATAQGAEAKAQQQYTEEQAKLDAENQKVIASIDGMTVAHTAAGAAAEASTLATVGGYQAVAAQVEITAEGVRAWLDLMRATNAANALLSQNSLFTTGSMLENQSRIGGAFSPIPGFASGVQNFEGGLAKVHGGEVLANLAPGTSVFPKGSGFGNVQMSNVFNLVDSESNLARKVSDLIMRNIRAGTQVGTA